jgi:P27 family predicted phage terminase small subunit
MEDSEIMGGRPRKPTAVKKLQGTLQPCRTNELEPMPSHALKSVAVPDYLSDKAKEIWLFAIEQAPEAMLTGLDFSVMAQWADTMAKIIECEEVLQREGMYIEDTKTGLSKPHPMAKFQDSLKYTLRIYLTELGFTPASRSKVNMQPKAKDDNEFLNL